jgi:hypothetical protein
MEKEKCCSNEECCEMTKEMLCLSEQAWADLMKEKMKTLWNKERGQVMDSVAKIVVKHNMALWSYRMQKQDMKAELSKEQIENFKEELGKAFMG